MVRLLGHRQTKEAATDKPSLKSPRHISTLPVSVQLPTGLPSLNVGLLGHLERVVNLDAEISVGT